MKKMNLSKSFTNRDNVLLDRYLKDIKKYGLLTPEEEAELARRTREGDNDAQEKLVNGNLRFVVSVAKHYEGLGVELMDLISEGNLGLAEAAKRFDETRGFKFISYAVNWVRQKMYSAISSTSRTIRLPVNKVVEFQKLKKANQELEMKLGRTPTIEEVAELLNMPEYKITKLQGEDCHCVSLDAPVAEDSDTTLESILDIEGHERTDHRLTQESLSIDVKRMLATLPEKERQVICLFFGINTTHEHTLDEIEHLMEISRERVRQLRDRAIKRLRNLGNSDLLRQHLAA